MTYKPEYIVVAMINWCEILPTEWYDILNKIPIGGFVSSIPLKDKDLPSFRIPFPPSLTIEAQPLDEAPKDIATKLIEFEQFNWGTMHIWRRTK